MAGSRRSQAKPSFRDGATKPQRSSQHDFQKAKFSLTEGGLTEDEDIVRIAAYLLQVNGAKPGTTTFLSVLDHRTSDLRVAGAKL